MAKVTDTNEKIGKWAGVKPRLSWEVVPPEGHATSFSSEYKDEVEDWLAKIQRDYPDSHYAGYHLEQWEHWPNYEYSPKETFGLLDVLASKGFCPVLAFDDDGSWGLSIIGCQSIGGKPLSVQAEFTDTGEMWKPTIKEAILHTVLDTIDMYAESI